MRVEFSHGGLLWIAVLAALVLVFLAMVEIFQNPLRGWRAGFLFFLRVLSVVCLVGFVAQLRLGARGLPMGQTISVVIDQSQSMADETSKIKVVLNSLSRWAKSKGLNLRYYFLGDHLTQGNPSRIGFGPLSPKSAIGKSLAALRDNSSCVVLLSDGVDTDAVAVPRINLGIFAIAFGGEPESDIVVEEVRYPSVVFSRSSVAFKVVLRYPQGLKEGVALRLKDEKTKEILWQDQVALSGFSPQQLELNAPVGRDLGRKRWVFEVEPKDWEKDAANNQKIITTLVKREKLRVLYLSGKPTFDYAYLRDFIRSQPSRELVSFVILRNPEDAPPFGESELSLIPFPAQEIFLKNLNEFDLFILQDFSFRRFGLPPPYLEKVIDFVREGGGLVLLMGANTVGAWELEPLLKAAGGVSLTSASNMEEGSFAFKISDPKAWNEFFPGASNLVWPPVSAFQEVHLTAGARPLVLAHAQSEKGNLPLVVVNQEGKGRTALLSFLGSWLWKSQGGGDSSKANVYDNFWDAIFNWVTGENIASRESVVSQKEAENPEFRASVDYEYLEEMTKASGGSLLGEALNWSVGVDPKYGDKILNYLEADEFRETQKTKPRGFGFDDWALFVAGGLLLGEWGLRRLWM